MKRKIYIQVIGLWLMLLFSGVAVNAQNTAQIGDTTTFSVNEVSGDTYIWELYDVASGVNFAMGVGNCPTSKAQFVNGNTGASVQIKWLEEGEYFYKVLSKNSCANNVKIGRVVIVAAEVPLPPSVSVTYDCEKGVAILTASNYTGKLLWSTGETTSTITVKEPGSYTVKQTLNKQTSPEKIVEIAQIVTSIPTYVVAIPAIIKKGESATLSAQGCENGTLHWFTDEALTQELDNAQVSPEKDTVYYVVCESITGCISEPASVTVKVNEVLIPEKPEITVEYDCERGVAILTASNYTGKLLWSTGEKLPQIEVTEEGEYTLVQIIDGKESDKVTTFVVNIKAGIPEKVVAIPPKIEQGGTSQLTAEGCEEGILRWFADKELTVEIEASQVRPAVSTTYYVVCESIAGCRGEAVPITVEVETFDEAKCKEMYKNITIEQLVTPNGDGYNDTWELADILEYCRECGKRARVKLFNRWGAKVYEKYAYMLDEERFDGYSENKLDHVNSERLPAGTYFYVITVKGEKEKTGFINIVSEKE